MAESQSAFGIYVHWPFCAAKCPYCDFNSHVRRSVDHERWRKGLLTDLRTQAELTDRLPVTSIFFGGGTPSLMEPSTVGAILDEIATIWEVSANLEVTLEANPTSVEASKFREFRGAGINRVSMGIQALNDPDLKALGRLHTAKEALAAFDIARSAFDRVSFDLIYARQNQSLVGWEAELGQALAMGVDHLSLYQLTIEPDTRFGDLYARGKLTGLPQEGLGADLFDLTQAMCGAAGLPAYEISNHARDGFESLHNLTYWRYQPYLGIGPGAHGRPLKDDNRLETAGFLNPEKWLAAVETDGHGLSASKALNGMDAGTEFALMGLRLTEGVSVDRYRALTGEALSEKTIGALVEDGYLWQSDGKLGTTQTGWTVLNKILAELL